MLSAPEITTFVSRREGHETALLSKRSATSETTVRDARPLKKVSRRGMEKRLVVRRMTCVSHHVGSNLWRIEGTERSVRDEITFNRDSASKHLSM